ncbi:hypothetical protein AYI68_g3331 [Smittium mucronatum]|uniref:Uncharacterized protein n=1 Tax=Smittium mucronatum TaxID=133383 RepID=A0A1R0H0A7_9FUNG|nr:hypothetical protein AYI68_g3331 [Smittium mucronatum]
MITMKISIALFIAVPVRSGIDITLLTKNIPDRIIPAAIAIHLTIENGNMQINVTGTQLDIEYPYTEKASTKVQLVPKYFRPKLKNSDIKLTYRYTTNTAFESNPKSYPFSLGLPKAKDIFGNPKGSPQIRPIGVFVDIKQKFLLESQRHVDPLKEQMSIYVEISGPVLDSP